MKGLGGWGMSKVGRKMSLNAEYFSHDKDMRNDSRVKALRSKFGLPGYAVFNMILETLCDSELLQINIEEDLTYELLAGDFGIDSDALKNILEYVIKLGLLQKNDGFIRCKRLDERLDTVFRKRKSSLIELRKTISGTEIGISATEIEVPASETPQSKVKESKEEYIHPLCQFIIDENLTTLQCLPRPLTNDQAKKLEETYPVEAIKRKLMAMENHKGSSAKKSVYLTVNSWLDKDNIKKTPETNGIAKMTTKEEVGKMFGGIAQ